jgi:hypothetical protein
MSDKSDSDREIVPLGSSAPPSVYEANPLSGGTPSIVVHSTFPAGEGDSLARYFAVTGQCQGNFRDLIGKEIAIVGLSTYVRESVDADTGEVTPRRRVVVHLEDGTSYGTEATTVVPTLIGLGRMKGASPWNPPVRILVSQGSHGQGLTHYRLALVQPAKTQDKKGK